MHIPLRTGVLGRLTVLLFLFSGWIASSAVAQNASVQVIHNSPDPAASTVDIYLDDGTTVTPLDDVDFRTATAFFDVSAGTYDIAVSQSTSTGIGDQELFRLSGANLVSGETYIVAAQGVVTPGDFATNPDGVSTAFDLQVITPARSSAVSSDVEILVVHGAPDAPTVDVIARGAVRLVDDAAFTDATSYIQVAPASYTLDVAVGTNNGLIPASAVADLSTAGGATVTVLASGFLDPSANQSGPAFGLLAVFADGTTDVLPAATAPTLISELRIDQPSADDDEYFEVRGEPGASLDDLTYLVIGDGSTGSGTIENATDLTGQTIPGNGYFVAAEASFTLATADLTTDLQFENGDNVTHLLVYGFTGADGDDLDTDDDGTLDSTPWTIVADAVGIVEETGAGEQFYGAALQFIDLGPNGAFAPAHAYRAEANDVWQIGNFDNFDLDTPGGANPLPVEFGAFTASLDGADVILQWTTLSETNNARFDIQQRSGDAAFAKVGETLGQGTTTEATTYSFRVGDLTAGTYQFRLRQVDVDGGESFSESLTVTVGLQEAFALETIRPHPVQATSTAMLQVERAQEVTAELFDLLGRKVQTVYRGMVNPSTPVELSVSSNQLQSGAYFLRVTGDDFRTTQRVTVVR